MDVIIGRYRICIEETGLILKHISGIKFDLKPNESLELLNFINVYRPSLMLMQATEHNADPPVEQVVTDKGRIRPRQVKKTSHQVI